MHDAVNKLRRAKRDLALQLDREASQQELAEYLVMPLTKLRYIDSTSSRQATLSFDTAISRNTDGRDGTLERRLSDDKLQPQDRCDESMMRDDVVSLLSEVLTKREARVLAMRFGLPGYGGVYGRKHSLQEVGTAVNLTRERVRQIEQQAMQKLRNPKHMRKVEAYLDYDYYLEGFHGSVVPTHATAFRKVYLPT